MMKSWTVFQILVLVVLGVGYVLGKINEYTMNEVSSSIILLVIFILIFFWVFKKDKNTSSKVQ